MVGVTVGVAVGVSVGDVVAVGVAVAVGWTVTTVGTAVSYGSEVVVTTTECDDEVEDGVDVDVASLVDTVDVADDVATTSVALICPLVCCVSGPPHADVRITSTTMQREAHRCLPLFTK